jgi:hypothetical protein
MRLYDIPANKEKEDKLRKNLVKTGEEFYKKYGKKKVFKLKKC